MRVTWYQKAKELKETLTSKPVASFSCEPLYDVNGNELINDDGSRREVRCEVSRDEFETMIAGRVDRAAHLVTSTLESLSLSPQDIGTVLLTGQSSQIPCFQRAIRKIFSHLPPEMQNTTMPLKESVAAGAAWAAMAQATNHVKLGRLDRTSYRYGIDGSWTSEASKGFVELIPLNSIFGQRKEHVKLLLAEGEHGFREMRIIQNGTQSDRVPDGTDPDVTIIGKIDLSGYPPGEIDFSLFFSTDTGMLTAEVNHQEVKIQPILDEASEAVYL
jgi:molecular chaperone DnaK (HSP70)